MKMNALFLFIHVFFISYIVSFQFRNFQPIKRYNHLQSKTLINAVGKRQIPEPIPDDALFQQWEKEEIEQQKLELLDEDDENDISDDDDEEPFNKNIIKSNKQSNQVANELPSYMSKILAEFNEVDEEVLSLPASKLPVVAVIGRPNTGKSTLVNKLTDSYKDGAIVHDQAGITRDRTYRTGSWGDYNFQVIDTGGIIFDDSDDIFADRITEQAILALKEATVAVMVCDGQQGLQPLDSILGDWLRKNCKVPLYVAVNKCESDRTGIAQAQDFWALGLGTPFPVSAIHGVGLSDLLDELTVKNMAKVHRVIGENATNVALIGRPNVGKSSLLNCLYGSPRSIVSDIAGTTRDMVDVLIQRRNSSYRVIDTAGIRRKPKVEYGAEFFMVNRAFKAIRRSDVVILLLDAVDGIVDQDRILAERIHKEGRSCIIALNKWDLVPEKDDRTYLKAIENIRNALPILKWAEVCNMMLRTKLNLAQNNDIFIFILFL